MENSETNEDFSENEVKLEDKNHIKEEVSDDIFLKPDVIKTVKKKPSLGNVDNQEGETSLPELKAHSNDRSSKHKVEKSPSQKIAEKDIPIPYKEPPWSGLPHCQYEFEVIKNGVVIDKIPFEKPYLVVGRQSTCDILMEHPSISRFHCIIQYRKESTESESKGVYVYDLESTHGTFQNKYRLLPKEFNRLRVGHILKFGGSTRLFILQGPVEDEEPESDLTVTELKEEANKKKLLVQKIETLIPRKNKGDSNLMENVENTEGIDWGMGEDAVEDEDEESGCGNPFASNEDLYLDDPKKTLRGWYEREGFELPEYQVEEIKPGSFKAKLELPISGSSGKSITCVIEHKGKKKEAVLQCALEACRILDRQGVLRQAVHESHEKKRKNWSENDYYDSDEDDFLDRTGDIERKRKQRKKDLEVAKGIAEEVETYDTLKRKHNEVISSLEKLEADLKNVENLKNKKNETNSPMDSDDLDSYMQHLSTQLPDKHKRIAWKIEVIKLNKEEVRLRKLINVARPLGVPELPERKSLHSDPKTKTLQQITNNSKNLSKKIAPIQKVHAVFLEEEEDERPKLRKVNCASPDNDDLTPIPYSKPQKVLTKYEQKIKLISSNEKLSEFANDKRLTISNESGIKYDNESNNSKVDEQVTTLKSDNESNNEEDSTAGTSGQSIKIIGPLLPQNSTNKLEFSQPTLPINQKKKKIKSQAKKSIFDFEEKYENWVPPQGQTGDGRTALNEKLGY